MIRDAGTMDRPATDETRRRSRLGLAVPFVIVAAVGAGLMVPMTTRWMQTEHTIQASRLRMGTVSRGDLISDVHVLGRLVSASHPTLFSAAAGIVNVRVRPGELVDKAQVLATIESPSLESELKQQRASLDSLISDFKRQRITNQQQNLTNKQQAEMARVNFVAAERERKRTERIHADGYVPEYELSKARDDSARAKLELDHAEQTIEQQKKSLRFELQDRRQRVERQQILVAELERRIGELVVRSPVDGLVGDVFVEDRDVIEERRPILKVVDLSVFEIDIEIPEGYADDVAVGAAAELKIGTAVAPGKITRVAPSVTAGRVSGTASFVETPPTGLRQNQRVDVRILIARRPNVIKAPRGQYVESGGRYVYVVRDRVAHRVSIEVGTRGVREVEIVSGLQPGDEIVLSDLSELNDAPRILLY